MAEIWKPVSGWCGLYEVSDLGNVRRAIKHRNSKPGNLKTSLDSHGYPAVSLCSNNFEKKCLVHRLVATEFCGLTQTLVTNHKNGVRTDNRAINLEAVTSAQNEQHKWRSLLTGAKTNCVINADEALQIRQLSKDGWSNQSLANRFGISRMSIWNVVNNRTWR